jgi:hypothetical protein
MDFNSNDPDLEKAARLLAASDWEWKVVYERFPKYALYLQAFREDSSKRKKGELNGPRSEAATVGNQLLSSISGGRGTRRHTASLALKPGLTQRKRGKAC